MNKPLATDIKSIELTVVIPCLNEAETIGICIKKALKAMEEQGVSGEVVVADNGSTDCSQEIVSKLGARLIQVREKGYGNALMGGISAAHGDYIIMGDADDSYNFMEIPKFLEKLRQGYDLVMGDRFKGGIEPGAMPWKNRYIGNPVLSGLGRLFFKIPCSDFHCGMRGFSKTAFDKMNLHTTGMEFASEMVIKASLMDMRIIAIPTTLSPDGRSRAPHLRPWRDGWRHLRFMLLYSPRWLFLYPGLSLMLLGFSISLWLLPAPKQIGSAVLDIHTLLYSSIFMLSGFQAVCFAIFSNVFAVTEGLQSPTLQLDKMLRFLTLEKGIGLGTVLSATGFFGSIYAFYLWGSLSYGPLDPSKVLRIIIPSITLFLLGIQIVLSSFLISFIRIKRK